MNGNQVPWSNWKKWKKGHNSVKNSRINAIIEFDLYFLNINHHIKFRSNPMTPSKDIERKPLSVRPPAMGDHIIRPFFKRAYKKKGFLFQIYYINFLSPFKARKKNKWTSQSTKYMKNEGCFIWKQEMSQQWRRPPKRFWSTR